MTGKYRVDAAQTTIDVQFPSRPSAECRGILKDAGYRWIKEGQLWRAIYSADCVAAAQRVAEPDSNVPREDRPALFKFGPHIDGAQMRAAADTEGPKLVVAGPGSGKTSTMVKRIAFLVLERGLQPERILVATFSRKASKELITRISNEFADLPHPVNVEKMRIGTFHSICQDILASYAEEAELRNFSIIEEYDQRFMLQYGRDFKDMRDAGLFCDAKGRPLRPERYAAKFAECSDALAEETVSLDALANSGAPNAGLLAQFVARYRSLNESRGKLDYADIQSRTLALLEDNPSVLADLQSRIDYVIVDEYQDTSFIQERIALLLAGGKENICVVGDDDQGLYRFRGATVQNILQFQQHFGGTCQRHDLAINYRSQKGIVDFCRRWMNITPGYEGNPTWGGCRYDKNITANPKFDPARENAVSVVRCQSARPSDWHERMLQLIRDIQSSPDFVDLNQIAFLCNSVKTRKVRGLIAFLEENGIRVNAPRANMFFSRHEVRLAFGCLMACFPSCDHLANERPFDECTSAWAAAQIRNAELAAWVDEKRQAHGTRDEHAKFNYAFTGLFYEMMRFDPFKSWLDQTDSGKPSSDARARNLSLVATICSRFESAESYPRFTPRSIKTMPPRFFGKYLRGIVEAGGIDEYEDERIYAPSGCISLMTIHQAKGMEFPVVVACSLEDEPWGESNPLVETIRSLNPAREELEPAKDRNNFDFWRKYYTAFSRAQDLLVLASCGRAFVTEKFDKPDPSPLFEEAIDSLPSADKLDYASLHLRQIKPANIMRTYSFTTDVAAYQACPRRYKLFRELGFPQQSGQGMLFGTLVHQCVEDIHRIVKTKRDAGKDVSRLFIPPDQIRAIVSDNRTSLERAENVRMLSREQDAFRQVMKYLKHSKSIWRDVIEPEAAVSEVRNGFVLKGVIDLIHGSDDCVEVVDFKTGKMPAADSRLLRKYRRQMLVYAHLVRSQLGLEVSGAKLYFTSDSADSPVIDVSVGNEDVEEILREFDATVNNIEARNFTSLAEDEADCKDCPFAGYCGRGRRPSSPHKRTVIFR